MSIISFSYLVTKLQADGQALQFIQSEIGVKPTMEVKKEESQGPHLNG